MTNKLILRKTYAPRDEVGATVKSQRGDNVFG